MNTLQKPNLVTITGVITLTSGIVNLFWGLIFSLTAAGTFIGIICVPLTLLPTVFGVWEIVYALKLLGNPPQPVRPSNAIAVIEIFCLVVGNAFSAAVGILALIFYNDVMVKSYFEQLNGMETPPPAAPVPVPAQPIDPTPDPVLPESAPDELPKPKRPRKLA
jgi:hypothetical protein